MFKWGDIYLKDGIKMKLYKSVIFYVALELIGFIKEKSR